MNWSRKIRDKGRSSRAAGATTAHIGRDARRAEGARSHGIPEFGRFGKQMTDDFVLQINPRKEYRLYDALRSFPRQERARSFWAKAVNLTPAYSGVDAVIQLDEWGNSRQHRSLRKGRCPRSYQGDPGRRVPSTLWRRRQSPGQRWTCSQGRHSGVRTPSFNWTSGATPRRCKSGRWRPA